MRAYFRAINNRDYGRAWRLGGRYTGSSYSAFVSGFQGTAHDTVTILSIAGTVVTARLVARQTDGSVRTYHGTYRVTHGVITRFHVARVSGAGASGVPSWVPMPNRSLTPGSVQSMNTSAICMPGWAEAHRDVSEATKNYVTAEYGLTSHTGDEIDHLIPLELGGSNATSNLWPEPLWSAHQKDGLEDYLHAQVCDHGLSLAAAQHEIAANWYSAWLTARKPTPGEYGYTNGGSGSSSGNSGSGGGSGGSGCHPTAPSGNCYEPGEFCPEADAGMTGVAGDGKTITCKLVSGRYHWED